jgi:hypothetical protein
LKCGFEGLPFSAAGIFESGSEVIGGRSSRQDDLSRPAIEPGNRDRTTAHDRTRLDNRIVCGRPVSQSRSAMPHRALPSPPSCLSATYHDDHPSIRRDRQVSRLRLTCRRTPTRTVTHPPAQVNHAPHPPAQVNHAPVSPSHSDRIGGHGRPVTVRGHCYRDKDAVRGWSEICSEARWQ